MEHSAPGAPKPERLQLGLECDAHSRVIDFVTTADWLSIKQALRLSPREVEYLRWALVDPRDRSIAERIGVGVHTAHTHRVRIFRKLGVGGMAQALSIVFATYVRMHRQRSGDRDDISVP